MKLRRKTLLIVGIAILCLNAVLYAVSELHLLRNFQNLEAQYVRQDVVRALDTLSNEFSRLNTIAQDYSEWDATYQFVKNPNPEYIKSNFVDSTFTYLHLNLVAILDREGNIVFQKGIPRANSQDNTNSDRKVSHQAEFVQKSGLNRYLEQKQPLQGHTALDSEITGFAKLGDRPPLMLASRPIVTSDVTGPIAGTLLVGRYLNAKELDHLAELTQLSLTLKPYQQLRELVPESCSVPSSLPTATQATAHPENIPVCPLSNPSSERSKPSPDSQETDERVAGYVAISDLRDRPAWILQIDTPRFIYEQGLASLHYFSLLLVGVGLSFGALTLSLIERLVLSPVASLSNKVLQVAGSGNLSERVAVTGNNELDRLAETINTMLAALENSQKEQQTSEERYRLMAENSTDLIARQTPQGIFLYASPASYSLLGYEPEELQNRSVYDFVHPQDWSILSQSYSTVMEAPVTATITYRIRHKDDRYVWFETSSRTVRHPQTQQVQEIVSVSRDITERKQVERDLRESESSIRNLYRITSSHQLTFEQQLQGLLAMGRRSFGMNVAVLSKVEGNRYEVIAAQSPHNAICAREVFSLSDTYCWETIHSKETIYFESVRLSGLPHRQHPKVSVEAYIGTPVIVAEEIYGTLSFASTVPRQEPFRAVDRELLQLMAQWIGGELERQQTAEDLAIARDRALAATQAKSEFLATMSHELRTPMNSVIGMTSLLLDTPLTNEQQDFVSTIRSSGEALLAIINDILDFSKIECGKLDLDEQPFDLQVCVEASLDLLASKAAQKQIELAYFIDPDVPRMLVGDVTRVRQILMNLLSNAVKFTDSGEVVLSVSARSLDPHPKQFSSGTSNANSEADKEDGTALQSAEDGSRYVVQFAVRDTGIGIPKERMHRLFQSFSQMDASTTRKYGGTGLGLAISQRLSELMGGVMWVESGGYRYVPTRAFEQSEPVSGEGEITTCMMRSDFERGSTFYFTIAADACQPTPQSEHRSGIQPLLADKIALVVDDNSTTLQQISVQLQAWGMIPRSMRTAEAARQCLEEGDSFNVAIWDGQIPSDSDRDKAMSYLAQQQVPVILLTDLWQTRETETSQSGLVRACINKPIKQSQLYNVLMEVCAGVSPEEPQVYNSPIPINSEMAEILPLRILLAEDHPVNLKVAVQILGRLGYRIDTAENGKQVLESLKRQPYDVVFMDVQMPEMDGLEATRQICELWSSGSRPRIIAMTANAMQGDREECMASGMDDYISKPIRMNELVQALRRCEPRRHGQLIIDGAGTSQTKQKTTNQPSTAFGNEREKLPPASSDGSQKSQDSDNTEGNSTPLDAETLQALKEIDALQEVIDIYLDSAPQLLQRIQEAVSTEQPEELREAAHSLKSTSAALGAFDLSEMAKKMEVMGRFGNTASASNMLADIEVEYQRVRKALDEENHK